MVVSTDRIQLQWNNETAHEAALISKASQNEWVLLTVMWAGSGLGGISRSANYLEGERGFVAYRLHSASGQVSV